MVDLFTIASNDFSVRYLAQVFGTMHGVIPAAGDTTTILGTMFMAFNSVVLTVGALIVVYTTVVGVIRTAYEGEFMGKNWGNVWIPIRTVLGIAALVPTASGYSAIQLLMMWVIVQGIGAADTLWTTVLKYVDITGSPYAQVELPSVGVYQPMSDLFKGLVCQQTLQKVVPDDANFDLKAGRYMGAGGSNPFPAEVSDTYRMGPDGKCGTLTYCNVSAQGACADANSLRCKVCAAQVKALGTIISVLDGLAGQLVDADFQYRSFYARSDKTQNAGDWEWIYNFCRSKGIENCCINQSGRAPQCAPPGSAQFPSPYAGTEGSRDYSNPSNEAVTNLYWPYKIAPNFPGDRNFISTIVNEYQAQLMDAADLSRRVSPGTSPVSRTLSDIQAQGWILAGSYYYDIAKMNNENLTQSLPQLGMTISVPDQVREDFRVNDRAAEALMSTASGAATAGGVAAQLPGGSQISDALGTVQPNISKIFDSVQTADNPLYQLMVAGTALLVTAELLFVALMAIVLALGFASGVNVLAAGFGFTENPLKQPVLLIFALVFPAMLALFGLLVTIGGTLGIYVPLIPYIMFTFGAIGWMISTIEAMVAGPLVALGILSPSGHHEILGKAEPALMLIFNIFLRPSLMIFGMVAAMLLSQIVVKMINMTFYTVMTGIQTGSAVIAWILFLCAYVLLIVTALNKCFSAIHVVPERVTRWLHGGGAESAGEAEAVGAIKGGVEAGAAGARGGGETGLGQAKELGAVGTKRKKGMTDVKIGGEE